jgi:aspartate/methionine/tyrosine aminotransferase
LPTDAEIDALFRWLRGPRRRLLIIDAVYTFDFSVGRALSDSLLADNQCLVLWSCSKSWLYPGVLGLAKVPASLAPGLRSRVSLPSDIEVGRVIAMLEGGPDLPRMQQDAFDREWRRLAPCLRSASPDWQPPATGYFSVVSAPFMRLLEEHGILSVPATVFGSRRNDLSIVTCLHALVANSAGNNFKI